MQPKIYFIAIVLITLLAAFSKPDEKWKVKTKYYIHEVRIKNASLKWDTTYKTGGIIYTFYYDDLGRRSSETSSAGNRTMVMTSGNMVVSNTINGAGKIIERQTEFLNAKAMTDSSVIEQNGVITLAHKFIYDTLGNTVEEREYQPGGMMNQLRRVVTYKRAWKNGNMSSETIINGVVIDTIVTVNPVTLKLDTVIQRVLDPEANFQYDYFLDKLNTTHGTSNSKNLLKRSFQISAKKDTAQVNLYRYTFDDKGRVVTEVYESVPGYSGGDALEYDSTAYSYY